MRGRAGGGTGEGGEGGMNESVWREDEREGEWAGTQTLE